MKRTSATRHEMLERNPHLKKYWLARLLIGPILMGAKMNAVDWKRLRLAFITGPLLIVVFAYNMLHDTNASTIDNLTGIVLIVFFTLGWPCVASAAYGYKNREHLDTTGGIKADLSFIGRYMGLWVMIGVGISTGVGIFSWLKW